MLRYAFALCVHVSCCICITFSTVCSVPFHNKYRSVTYRIHLDVAFPARNRLTVPMSRLPVSVDLLYSLSHTYTTSLGRTPITASLNLQHGNHRTAIDLVMTTPAQTVCVIMRPSLWHRIKCHALSVCLSHTSGFITLNQVNKCVQLVHMCVCVCCHRKFLSGTRRFYHIYLFHSHSTVM